jgi:MCP family monocarboxylic acid transporter-like MFS transporter 10
LITPVFYNFVNAILSKLLVISKMSSSRSSPSHSPRRGRMRHERQDNHVNNQPTPSEQEKDQADTLSWSRSIPEKPAGSLSIRKRSVSRSREDSQNVESERSSIDEENLNEDEPNWPTEWRAYVSLLGCFFLMFNSWGLVNAYGTFASYYKEELLPNTDILLLNLVGSTESFIVLVNSFIIGRLLDSGHARKIVFVGWFFVSLGMFTLSLSSGNGGYNKGHYGLIWLTQGLTTGMGMACFFVSSSQSQLSYP